MIISKRKLPGCYFSQFYFSIMMIFIFSLILLLYCCSDLFRITALSVISIISREQFLIEKKMEKSRSYEVSGRDERGYHKEKRNKQGVTQPQQWCGLWRKAQLVLVNCSFDMGQGVVFTTPFSHKLHTLCSGISEVSLGWHIVPR